MRLSLRLVGGALVAALLLAPAAVAAPRRPAKDTKEIAPEQQAAKDQARLAYQRATKHYNLGEYQQALDAFRDAYRLYEDSSFLFNIAQCQRQLGVKLDAVRSYRAFLRIAPDARNRPEVERLMAELEAELREESKARPPQGTIGPGDPPATTATTKPAEPDAEVKPVASTTGTTPGAATTSATSTTTTADSNGSTPVYKRWWLWTAIGVVLVAGALAVGLGVGMGGQVGYPSAATSAGTFRF